MISLCIVFFVGSWLTYFKAFWFQSACGAEWIAATTNCNLTVNRCHTGSLWVQGEREERFGRDIISSTQLRALIANAAGSRHARARMICDPSVL
jgi:hypothetical protein